jgi:endo-1,4-beta-xylanase
MGMGLPAVVTSVLVGCGSSLPPTTDVATTNPHPLRELAGDFLLGTAVDQKAFATEPLYQDIIAYQFNAVVGENKMKMAAVQPDACTAEPCSYNFAPGDGLIAFARQHGMRVRGHTLVYPNGSPPWLLAIDDAATLQTAMTRYITDVMHHWAGQVAEWDVVNEPYDYDPMHPEVLPALDNKIFTKLLHEDYIDLALSTARAADPNAKLFINENGIELGGPKLDALAAKVASLRAKNLIDGVGMEFHVELDKAPADAVGKVACAMKQLTDLGVEIHVTELDIRVRTPATADDLAAQATLYAGILDACRANAKCTGFLVWGFSDRWSWIPGQYDGFGEADLLDDTYALKPAYDAVQTELGAAPTARCP